MDKSSNTIIHEDPSMRNYVSENVQRKSEEFRNKVKELHDKVLSQGYKECTEQHFTQMKWHPVHKRIREPVECYKCGWGKKEEKNVEN